MQDVKNSYTEFHKKKYSKHLYPTEWVIRTMVGNYPELKLDKSKYNGGKVLDLGFGDGRNFLLLKNCGLDIYGIEITEDTVEMGKKNLEYLQVDAQLKVGSNANIPFAENFFDYVLSSSSCYYIDENSSFEKNLTEMARVLKRGGSLIANFPAFVKNVDVPVSFILENAIQLDDGYIIIQNDIYGIRNGYKFKTFNSKESIITYFERDFRDISVGICLDNYYGIQINYFIVTALKK